MITLREEGWLPHVRARIEALLHAPSRGERRVAVLDWDNTMMRGDVGDLALAWMLENGGVMRTRWEWGYGLTGAAIEALERSMHLVPIGEPVPRVCGAELSWL